ncbi:hypothetical protein XELAEV_18038250mg [Xenopus laevis]|uniref:Fibrinogen C-terminal domain-containing protein n=1 Tax=Xenopus laevis TaxID=8355 RepID=A0A974C5P3_XENLA|nr:hypothetical protein XELAEV_18038250mg [Xenopus laevis]
MTRWVQTFLLLVAVIRSYAEDSCPDVKVIGVGASDKLTILRGCPGIQGVPGPQGPAGPVGAKGNFQLRVDLTDFSDKSTYASYSNFSIAEESQSYTLSLRSFMGGDAGDSLSGHKNFSFSTKDRDNKSNCAHTFKGGWWYETCHYSNLNGLYLHGNHTSYANGVNWSTGRGYHYSYKVSEMKFRPQP